MKTENTNRWSRWNSSSSKNFERSIGLSKSE